MFKTTFGCIFSMYCWRDGSLISNFAVSISHLGNILVSFDRSLYSSCCLRPTSMRGALYFNKVLAMYLPKLPYPPKIIILPDILVIIISLINYYCNLSDKYVRKGDHFSSSLLGFFLIYTVLRFYSSIFLRFKSVFLICERYYSNSTYLYWPSSVFSLSPKI